MPEPPQPSPAAGEIRLGVVGAGVVGRSVAGLAARSGVPVLIYDNRPDAAHAAAAHARQVRPDVAAAAVEAAADPAQLRRADVILEATPEQRVVKRRVLAQIARHATPHAVLASGTSSLPLAELADSAGDRGRFCALHFCHPVERRPLVEVAGTADTSDATLDRATQLVRSLGQAPLRVGPAAGFVVNRLLFAYLCSAFELLSEGADWRRVEAAAVAGGMPWGPLHQIDEMGIDTTLRVAANLLKAIADGGPRPMPPAFDHVLRLYQRRRLGKKSGGGFFDYNARGRATPGPVLAEPALGTPSAPPAEDDELLSRLYGPLAQTASMLVASRVAAAPGDIDLAMRLGLGFTGSVSVRE